MCVGKDEIRDVALGLEMEGLENWVYEYQKVLIDEKQGEIVGFWKQIVNKSDGTQDEIYGIGGSWFRLNADRSSSGSATSSISGTWRRCSPTSSSPAT